MGIGATGLVVLALCSYSCFLPLISEARAATIARPAFRYSATCSAPMNDGAIAFGNHVVDVIVNVACALKCAPARAGRRAIISFIGLYPRKAAKRAIVGGMLEK